MVHQRKRIDRTAFSCPVADNLEDMTEDIVAPFPDLNERAKMFFAKHRGVIGQLLQTRRVERLRHIYQLGAKYFAFSNRPYRHHRLLHSQHVAAHMLALGLKLGLPEHEVLIGVFGSLLHDVGYGAFSHDGDYFLHPNNYPHHEERGKRLILEDDELNAVFRAAQIPSSRVYEVVAEAGQLGVIQSICDTAAYVVLDSLAHGHPVPRGMSSRYIECIEGIVEGQVLVNDHRPLQWAMSRRGLLGREVYFAERAKLVCAGNIKLLQFLYEARAIGLEQIAEGNDDSVITAVRQTMYSPRLQGIPWLKSLVGLVYGDYTAEAVRWRGQAFDTPLEAAIAACDPSAISYKPWDYARSKSLSVRLPDGTTRQLSASARILRPSDRQHHVFVFTG